MTSNPPHHIPYTHHPSHPDLQLSSAHSDASDFIDYDGTHEPDAAMRPSSPPPAPTVPSRPAEDDASSINSDLDEEGEPDEQDGVAGNYHLVSTPDEMPAVRS